MRRVVVTGLGALSPFGRGAAALWDGLLEGRTGLRPLSWMAKAGLPVWAGGEVDAVDRAHPERDRILAEDAIDQALNEAGLSASQTGFVWATGLDTFESTRSVHRPAGACFSALAARHRAPRRMVAVACASGTQTLGDAFHLIRAGRAEACVAGGSSAMLTVFYLVGFGALGAVSTTDDPANACKPFDRRRAGFALADGAAALVLEDLDHARRRGAEPLGEIVGFGGSADAFDLNRPPEDGAGAEACMRRALSDARLSPDDLDAVCAHATGTLAGDIAEAAALQRLLGDRVASVPVFGTKGAIGHGMASAGALEAVAALLACRIGRIPPTVGLEEADPRCRLDHVRGGPRDTEVRRVLSSSFGMGGQNAAIVLERMS